MFPLVRCIGRLQPLDGRGQPWLSLSSAPFGKEMLDLLKLLIQFVIQSEPGMPCPADLRCAGPGLFGKPDPVHASLAGHGWLERFAQVWPSCLQLPGHAYCRLIRSQSPLCGQLTESPQAAAFSNDLGCNEVNVLMLVVVRQDVISWVL